MIYSSSFRYDGSRTARKRPDRVRGVERQSGVRPWRLADETTFYELVFMCGSSSPLSRLAASRFAPGRWPARSAFGRISRRRLARVPRLGGSSLAEGHSERAA